MKIFYLLSHPIQYFSPMLAMLNNKSSVDMIVYYCSDHTLKNSIDKQFGKVINWDTPLLEGYQYHFLKNISPKPALSGKSIGLINPGIFKALRKETPDVLILHGWSYITNLMAMLSAKMLGIEVWMRSESPLKQENSKGLKRLYKKFVLKFLCNKYLYIGKENKEFYKSFGISDDKLCFTPYAVDNERFYKDYLQNISSKYNIRKTLSIPDNAMVVLYSGKFIAKKRPMDLVKAIEKLKDKKVFLIMLGSGELENEIKDFIQKHSMQNITLLPGFVNQTQLFRYFIASDIFVLPSGKGETWGLVVNEAMNFHLPVIVSDMVGCTKDLVKENINGFTFECGNINDLLVKIDYFIEHTDVIKEWGEKSFEIISNYSYNHIVKEIVKLSDKS